MTMSTALEVGPVDYLVVEFPGNNMSGEALPALVDLADRGIIRILDLVFVRRDEDGSTSGMELRDQDGDGVLDLTVFESFNSGLLTKEDLDDASAILQPGSSAGVLIFENTWAAPFVGALHRSGGELVASGRIPADELLSAFDAAEGRG
jgi:hypothetical protein